MYTIELLLRCAFHLCASSSESCHAMFLHDESFAQAVLQLVLSVTRCRYNTIPSLTTKCVIYAFRLLGQIFCLPNPHRSSSAADLNMILAMCDLSYRWLSTHMAWTLCAAEVSLAMANAMAYFTPVAAQLWLNPAGQLYLSHCLLPSLGVSFACSQSLRFIFNLLICDAVEPLKLSRLYSHTIGRAILVRLDRLVLELTSLIACLSNTRCTSEWMSECVSQLLDICALFKCRSSATELRCEPTKSELPNLFRIIEELGKAPAPEIAVNSLQRFANIFSAWFFWLKVLFLQKCTYTSMQSISEKPFFMWVSSVCDCSAYTGNSMALTVVENCRSSCYQKTMTSNSFVQVIRLSASKFGTVVKCRPGPRRQSSVSILLVKWMQLLIAASFWIEIYWPYKPNSLVPWPDKLPIFTWSWGQPVNQSLRQTVLECGLLLWILSAQLQQHFMIPIPSTRTRSWATSNNRSASTTGKF